MSDFEEEEEGTEEGYDVPDETPEEILRAVELFRRRPESTIYRVPPEIFSCDRNAYQPKAVCIGPFFHSWRHRQALKSMQDYKLVCVDKLISRRGLPRELLIRKLLAKMKELEGRVRRSYSETFPSLEPHPFRKMLILDGCFILHLLLGHADSANDTKVDDDNARKVYGRLWIWNLVRYDLLLLQNQIPFFVIQSIHDMLKRDDDNINLVDCATNLFGVLDPCRKQEETRFYIPVKDVHHLLHLIYLSVLPCTQNHRPSPKSTSPEWIPGATELKLAGVTFKERQKNGSSFLSFLDVKFSDGVMEIPRIKVHDYSVSLFRNLIAFEQCYPDTQCQITAYAAFMNLLIHTEQDMRLLHLNGILINSMSVDKDAIHFFSRLCNEVHHARSRNYLGKLFSDVKEHHDSKLHQWRAYLFREYFSNPWSIISLTAGAIALAFSIFGTLYNVISR